MKTRRRISPPKSVSTALPSDSESAAPTASNADMAFGPHTAEQPPLLRVADAAHALRVSERSIHNYLDQGLLQRVKIGTRTLRISRASLLRLMGEPGE